MSDMYYYDNLNPNLEFVMSWYNDKILPTNEEISEIIKIATNKVSAINTVSFKATQRLRI